MTRLRLADIFTFHYPTSRLCSTTMLDHRITSSNLLQSPSTLYTDDIFIALSPAISSAMRPRGIKDEDSPPHASRVPSSSRLEPEHMPEKDSAMTSQYEGEEESEDGRESDTAAAPWPVLGYHRQVNDPPTPLRAALQAQTPTRPQDPQTPPCSTSRGLEGDLARAGEVLREQTGNEYHRRRADARKDHAEHTNSETSSVISRAQAGVREEVAVGGQHPPQGLFTTTLRRNEIQQLGIPPSNPFGYGIDSVPKLPPQTTQTIGGSSGSGGLGSSIAAMTPFHRQANQTAFERQAARQETSPEPDLPLVNSLHNRPRNHLLGHRARNDRQCPLRGEDWRTSKIKTERTRSGTDS